VHVEFSWRKFSQVGNFVFHNLLFNMSLFCSFFCCAVNGYENIQLKKYLQRYTDQAKFGCVQENSR
jgi:hypothetical protein